MILIRVFVYTYNSLRFNSFKSVIRLTLKFLDYKKSFTFFNMFSMKKPIRFNKILTYLYNFFALKYNFKKPFKIKHTYIHSYIRVVLKSFRFKYMFYKTRKFSNLSLKKKFLSLNKIDIHLNRYGDHFYKNLLDYEVSCEEADSSSSSSSSSSSEEEYGIIAKYEISPDGEIVRKKIIIPQPRLSPNAGLRSEDETSSEEIISSDEEEEDIVKMKIEAQVDNDVDAYGLNVINMFTNVVTGFIIYLFISSFYLYRFISGITTIKGYCGLSVNTPISRYTLFSKNFVEYKNFMYKTFKKVKMAKVFNFMRLSYIRYIKFSYNFKKK